MSRRGALWVLAGLLGIAIAAGITWATSQLTSQHIGLSSEPLSAARGLAPSSLERPPVRRSPARDAAKNRASTGSGVPKGETAAAAATNPPAAPRTVEATAPPAGVKRAPAVPSTEAPGSRPNVGTRSGGSNAGHDDGAGPGPKPGLRTGRDD
jgi:hypothetical protein